MARPPPVLVSVASINMLFAIQAPEEIIGIKILGFFMAACFIYSGLGLHKNDENE